MSWQDKVGAGVATFRGVPFFVGRVERSGGRAGPRHKFPFSETAPYKEDTGAEGEGYPVEGYVIGSEYLTARDALLAALATPGSGELVHPYYGVKRVTATTYRVTEEPRSGGLASFTIQFDETSAAPEAPTVSIDAPAALVTSAAAVKASALDEFLSKFSEVAKLRDSATAALTAVASNVSAVMSKLAMPGQVIAELTQQVNEITFTASALADAPEEMAAAVLGLVESLAGGLLQVASLANPSATILALLDVDLGNVPPETTPNRLAERVNYDAFQNYYTRAVLAQATLVAVEQTFPTYEQAVSTRLAIVAAMDAHVEAVTDDTFPELEQLRADLTQAIPGEANDLPRLVNYTPRATVCSLVLAHTLYGNLSREADLIARNGITNPLFIEGGVELEVLSDE